MVRAARSACLLPLWVLLTWMLILPVFRTLLPPWWKSQPHRSFFMSPCSFHRCSYLSLCMTLRAETRAMCGTDVLSGHVLLLFVVCFWQLPQFEALLVEGCHV